MGSDYRSCSFINYCGTVHSRFGESIVGFSVKLGEVCSWVPLVILNGGGGVLIQCLAGDPMVGACL